MRCSAAKWYVIWYAHLAQTNSLKDAPPPLTQQNTDGPSGQAAPKRKRSKRSR